MSDYIIPTPTKVIFIKDYVFNHKKLKFEINSGIIADGFVVHRYYRGNRIKEIIVETYTDSTGKKRCYPTLRLWDKYVITLAEYRETQINSIFI